MLLKSLRSVPLVSFLCCCFLRKSDRSTPRAENDFANPQPVAHLTAKNDTFFVISPIDEFVTIVLIHRVFRMFPVVASVLIESKHQNLTLKFTTPKTGNKNCLETFF